MNLKISDNSVNHIVNKILKKRSQKSEQITDRYYEQEQKQDSRITNYQLHDKNAELRRQFKKLQKLFNNKLKLRQTLNSTDMEISELRQKLRNVLNMSQTLQLSLVKIRQNQPRKQQKSIQQNHCCCRKYRQIKILDQQNKKSKYKSKNKQVQTSSVQIPYKLMPTRNHSQYNTITIEKQTQCNISNQQKINSIQNKRIHIEKLKKLIQAQNKMIQSYQSKISSQNMAGKITKATDIKMNSYIKTCPSAGSIIKLNRQ